MLAKSRPFRLIMAGCAQFVLLTLLAMLVYAGGNAENPDAPGYQFFRNFFSDLGLTIAYNGEANTASFLLFTIALSLAGLSLIVFFILMPRFFKQDKMALALTWLGSLAGLVAGACFIGVAFTPANLLLQAHVNFVFGAFGSYFVAVLFYVAAMFKLPTFARVYQLVLLAFAFILGGYVWLLFNGPENLTIQIAEQKIIAYASITTVFIQAYGAWQKERLMVG